MSWHKEADKKAAEDRDVIMKTIKKGECLMIELNNNRKLFTQKGNYPQLIEFSKTFGAEISVVKVKEETDILDLQELPKAICSEDEPQKLPKVEIVEKRLQTDSKTEDRKTTLKRAERIRNYIQKKFLQGKTVKLSNLEKQYRQYELSSSTFSNHLREVRRTLLSDGHKIEKLRSGEYRLVE